MVRKITKKEQPKYHCRDCKFSYDWHEKGYDGKPFLCKCPFYKEGKWYKFLKDKECANFKLRT